MLVAQAGDKLAGGFGATWPLVITTISVIASSSGTSMPWNLASSASATEAPSHGSTLAWSRNGSTPLATANHSLSAICSQTPGSRLASHAELWCPIGCTTSILAQTRSLGSHSSISSVQNSVLGNSCLRFRMPKGLRFFLCFLALC